ncbi:SCY1 protein kinase [Zalerion maritima]|uniref:SCY1 protein kinase n=1 Tax=Zalerion maritima TaxID=339359 RepID=A0AAD5RFW4_9PEZI|nr:SCY1 protein kinase [Zalerion maritima]
MFSAALKSISSSNINANYSISSNVLSVAGSWKIHDAKKKSTGQPYSAFVFDKKSLDSHGGSFGSTSSRGSSSSMKRTVEEVIERLKKEASSLAKLRHPNVLELVEPVEETRGGGLQFVTEPVSASLASLLRDKDDQERHGGVGGRSSRYVTEDSDGVRRRRELEIDELEIQKGLLQVSKALEFLHDNAGLVHSNLTPEGILVNAKSDWKISGLAFCTPADGSTKPTSIPPISLSEVLNPDPRLPRFVQLDLDYTSPDFVLDTNLTSAADMFSLGLLCIALYNSPHKSPIESHGSVSSYRRLFGSSSTVPNANNSFLASRPLPRELATHVLPRLITRRPAQRMTAKEFQASEYFNNILISSIRFLDSFPAKTPNEKQSFLRGLLRVLPEFPKSVMEKKLLPALLDEMKDKGLIPLILQNVFKMVDLLPAARRVFTDKVRPSIKEIFVPAAPKQPQEKDPARDAGLMVVLENLNLCSDNCNRKEFKDDILPIILAAIESPTHAVVDAALRGLPPILGVLDFSTIKNELFPVISMVFSRTNSLAIKVRGLQAFVTLCGGSNDASNSGVSDGLDGLPAQRKKTSSSSALDKYTMQEKIIPLIKAIKTKEPAVMMAALAVLRVVGGVADAEFVAMDILPVLWSMSLGPLLDLNQFMGFMELIRSLSQRVEDEQTRKLTELGGQAGGGVTGAGNEDFLSFGGLSGTAFEETGQGGNVDDFESLVKGRPSVAGTSSVSGGAGVGLNPMDDNAGWGGSSAPPSAGLGGPASIAAKARAASPALSAGGGAGGGKLTAAFSWSTPSSTTQQQTTASGLAAPTASKPMGSFRTVTPDLGSFAALTPSATQFSKPLQPNNTSATTAAAASAAATPNPWSTGGASPAQTPGMGMGMGNLSGGIGRMSPGGASRPGIGKSTLSSASTTSSFSLPPPPPPGASTGRASSAGGGGLGSFSLAPPPGSGGAGAPNGTSSLGGLNMGFGANSNSSSAGGFKYGGGLGGSGTSMGTVMGQQQSMGGMGTTMGSSINNNNGMNMGVGMGMNSMMGQQQQQAQKQQKPAQQQGQGGGGLDKYESLL